MASSAGAQLDAGEAPAPHTPFLLPFTATDVVFDSRRGMLYATSIAEKRVYFVDLASGLITRQFNFALMPESLALTPDGSRLFVALLSRPHSYYWFDPHSGTIASFDLDLQVKDRQFPIAEDPFDLVATGNGQLVVSSGSGQWTYARVFDAVTGVQRGATGVRQSTRLALHPSESIVYGATTDLSPADIERYDLSASGALTLRWDSLYHGDHRMSGNVWASPLGDVLITRGGDVFTAAGTSRTSDMLYLRGLTSTSIEALAFDSQRKVIFTGHSGELAYYNLHSLESIGGTSVPGGVSFVGVVGLGVYAVQLASGQTRILYLDHPVPDGDTDTAPSATSSVSPASGVTTLTDVTFDASASGDAQGTVLYRWDLDGDGVWDTPFSSNPVLVHRFQTAGTKFVRVQVKDSAGWVSQATLTVNVTFQPDPGQPGTPNPGFVLPFPVTDAAFDPIRPYLYVSSKQRKEVHFVNTRTGFIEKTFTFPWMTENLALTPDGSRLFVALLTKEHDYYGSPPAEGYIASFDLALQVKDRQFKITEDPFGLVATNNGKLVVSSGLGQLASARVFNAVTGALLSSVSSVWSRTRFALHPGGSILYDTQYGARFDLSAAGILTRRWYLPVGGRGFAGNAWPSPLGDVVIARGGDVFTAAGTSQASDISYLRSLTPGYIDALAYDAARNVVFTGTAGDLGYYNLRSYESIGSTPLAGKIGFLGLDGLRVLALLLDAGQARLVEIAHPLPQGDTDTAPSVAYSVSPASGATTLTDVTFDASASSDAQGALLYRWDLDGDGVWDTPFASNPVLVHRFHTAGTKFVRVQVKDSAGWVSQTSFTVDVAFQPDPGEPGAPHPGFTLQFQVSDAVFDPLRPYLYVASRERKQVHFVNTQTGFIEKTFSFDWMPESLALTPDGSRLFVGLTLGHIYYSPSDTYTGYVAGFDLDLQVKDRQFPIAEDPFDLVATSNGRLVVSSGSGQWTYARVFDAATGALISSVYGIRHLSRLALHPSQSIVYAADTDLSPSDIERYDLSPAGVLAARWDSPYHGDHRMGGNVWASPLGDVLITRGGDVFTAAGADRTSDMIYLAGLTPSYIDAVAFDATRNVIFTGRDGDLGYYNLRSFESIGAIPVTGKIGFLGVRGLRAFALLLDAGQARLVEIAHPVPHGDTDTAPVAAIEVTPETGHTTLTEVTLDASASTDAEGPLLYRWDLNDDGVWETEYSANPVLVRRFSTAGTKFIRLRVKDNAGNVDDLDFTLDVAFQPDPGAPGEAHPSFRLPFAAAHAVFDPLRPYAYVTSRQRRSLYFVNLETGFIERAFGFEEMPERMALSPDGSKLYVALLTRDHNPYFFEEQVGFIARFDLAQKVKDRQFEVDIDPFDLAPTGDGRLVVTSGSGQWTDIAVYDGDTGEPRGRAGTIRERSAVDLHPSGAMVYTAGGTSYPQDVHRWSLTGPTGVGYAWDSIYHGHHRVGDDLWVSPRGDALITAGADVYGANGATRATDILFQRSLASTAFRDLVWSPALDEFAVIEDNRVRVYDMTTWAELATFGLPGTGRFIGRRGPLLYAMQVGPSESRLDVLVHGNHAPTAAAAAAAQVECDSFLGASVELDASGSSDPDSIPELLEDIVSLDWFEVDPVTGEWVAIGAGEQLIAQLAVGSHDLRVRVTDHAGASATAAVGVSVVDSTPPDLSIFARPPWLAPPLGRLVRVRIEVATSDVCGEVAVALVSAKSNAPTKRPIDHHHRGGHPPDILDATIGADDRDLLLRAEQNPGGPRRTYTLSYSATDPSGNQTLAQVEIPVVMPPGPWLFWLRMLQEYWD